MMLKIDIGQQTLSLHNTNSLIKTYPISTAKNGIGEIFGSEKTPRGWHDIFAKIGHDSPANTVFVRRRPTGEIFSAALREQFPQRDWILTRILWLRGLEREKNRLRTVDTLRRYIYIHGTPDDVEMGTPGSRGCIRMRNSDLIELFDSVAPRTRVLITE